MKIIMIVSILAGLILAFSGCKKEDDNSNEVLISIHNETESHNIGKACQSCHAAGGSGEGWFGVAGSVYGEDLTSANPNGTIYLYTGAGGTGNLVATIEVDGKGNFYSTASSIPAGGVYAQIKSASGNTTNMSMLVTSGNCNSCHGESTAKIWIN